ncbi:MAG: M15 family metallopeptidase [Bacteroidia bacterium]|nr:M15 family metallopeptidase [Bacteroidia bacterium]
MKSSFWPPIFLLISLTTSFFLSCENHATTRNSSVPTIDSISQDSLNPMSFDTIEIKYLLGKFTPEEDSNFVKMEDLHCAGSARRQVIDKKTYKAFIKMYEAAKADGVILTIKSATRNFYYQKSIWEAKWNGSRLVGGKNLAQTVPNAQERARIILKYSSMPGTSRHHWGTDFDLNAFENEYFESGKGLKEFQWLEANARKFGFGRPYTTKGEHRPQGYEEEKWHWSYLPLAQSYQKSYKALVKPEMISGFAGSETATSIDVIKNYVFGIDPSCFDEIGK